jgi:hypothetical protein
LLQDDDTSNDEQGMTWLRAIAKMGGQILNDLIAQNKQQMEGLKGSDMGPDAFLDLTVAAMEVSVGSNAVVKTVTENGESAKKVAG